MPIAPVLQQSIGMIQDYNQTLIPPIANSVANCFVAVQRVLPEGLQTELMTISDQNRLMWFRPDGKSGSGWRHDTIYVSGAPRADISRVIAFYQADQLYAFAGYANPGSGSSRFMGMTLSQTKGWIAVNYGANAENALSKLAQPAMFADSDGTNYIYGVAEAFQPTPLFSIVGLYAGKFAVQFTEPSIPGVSYKLLPGTEVGSFVILTLDGARATFRGARLNPSTGVIRLDGTSFSAELGLGPLAAENVLPAPRGAADRPTFLLLASDQNLYVVAGDGLGTSGPPVVTRLTGGSGQPGGVLSMTAGVQATGVFSVFAIEAKANMVWALAPLEAGGYQWTPLGNQGNAIAAPVSMAAGLEVFIYNLDTRLIRLVQAPDTGSWFTYPIATPSLSTDPLTEGSSYSYSFTVVDGATKVALGSQVLSIYVDTPQVLVINSIAFHVTPSKPATVQTNWLGQLTVTALASALASPVLTISGTIFGSATLGPFRADLDMHKRLAGQDPNFKITGQRFIDDGFLPYDTPKDDADSFADAVQQMSGVAVNIATDPASAIGSGPVAFKLDYSGGKAGFRCRPLAEAERAALFGGGPEGITSVFGDVANFFKHVWNDIEEIYVQVESAASKVAKFVMKVAGEVKSFILTTIDDIRDGLEMIFQAMAKFFDEVIDFIKKVIEWLKLLFNWKNILRSKRVLSYLFEQNLANIRTGLGPSGALQTWINGQFATLQGSIESYFHSIEAIFGPDNTFNTFVPSSAGQNNPQLSGSPPLEAAPLDTQWQANGVQNTYVLNKAIAGLPDALTEAMAEFQGENLGQQLIDAFKNAIPTDEFEDSLKTLMAFFKEVDSVDSFFNVVIYAFLVAAEDAVLLIVGLIQAFIDVLLTLGGEAVALFQAFLTKRIDIPVLSSLYEVIAGDHLTMLDLGCLILAVPGTILYDILYGHAPFTDDDVKRFTAMQIVWPWDRPMAGAGGASEQSSQDEQLWATVLTFAILAGALYGLTDAACDVANVGQQAVSGSAEGSDPLGIGNTTYSAVNLIAAFSSWVLNGPWLDSSMHEATTADKLNWSAWAMGLVPLLSDCCFLFGSPQKESTRFQPGIGPGIVTAIGLSQLGVGIAAAVEFKGTPNFNRCSQAAVVLGPVANVGKVATYIGYAGPEAVNVARAILGILDIGSDIGAAILGAIPNGPSSSN